MTPGDLAVSNVCATHGWVIEDDLTERISGHATPVLRVSTPEGPGVLRTGVDLHTLTAYRRFNDSAVTPRLLAHGTESGKLWLLVEWINGDPLLTMSPAPGTVDTLVAATGEVLTAVRRLYVHPAPQAAHQAAVEEGRRVEMDIVMTMDLAKSAPHVMATAQNLWEPATLVHGDLLATNAVRQSDGRLRLIDPAGGFGPPEVDAGRWLAAICGFILHAAGTMDRAVEQAGDTLDGALDAAPWLDRHRLHAWTAVQLCDYARARRSAGDPAGEYRALVALGGRLESRGAAGRNSRTPRNAACPCGSGVKYKKCCARTST